MPPAEQPTPAPADAKGGSSAIPEEVLKIPAVFGVLQGTPPAVYAEVGDTSDEVKVVDKHAKQLVKSGLDFYRTKDKAKIVLFNGLLVKPEEIAQADAAGNLGSIAAPFAEINAAISGGEPMAKQGQSAAPPAPMAAPPADVQNQLTTKRTANLTPGGPTSGAAPGAGRILNNILKPAY